MAKWKLRGRCEEEVLGRVSARRLDGRDFARALGCGNESLV
jgi:hypothetical protein